MMKNSFLELCKIEKDYNLLDWKLNNIYVWQYLRAEIAHRIGTKNNSQNNTIKKTKPFYSKIKYLYYILKNSILYNPFFAIKKYDRIVFLSSRKFKINDNYIDVYTQNMINDKSLVIDSSPSEIFNTKYKRNSIINIMMFILRFFLKSDVKQQDTKVIESILNKTFNTDINLYSLFVKYIPTYKSFFIIYNLLFKYIKPKEIVIVASYGQAPLIMAAKQNGIKVIEMQHGIISKTHYGYSYPFNNSIACFPDYLYVFGEYFRHLEYVPIPSKKIKIYYNEIFKNNSIKYRNSKKEVNSLVIISDATVMDGKLQKFILANKNTLNQYTIYYKLHPQEIVNDQYKSNKLTQEILKLNFIKVVSNEYSLYELLVKSKYVISPISTVIFEALELSCKIIIPKIGYWEDLESLKEYILFVDFESKLDFKIIDKYFKNIIPVEKGYFISSLKQEDTK